MTVLYEVRDQIAYISFNRPEKHNALRDVDLASLVDAMERLDRDEDAEIGILFGQGKSFSSGGDVKDRIQYAVGDGATAGHTNEAEAFTSCTNWKPIIAAIHGYCLGHALGTALHCDHLIAGRDARFQVTEIKLGLAMPGFLPRLGNARFAAEVAMTGRMFSAEEAAAAGMLTRLADEGQHLAAAEDLARQILENPRDAVRQTVRVRRTIAAEEVDRYQSLRDPSDWATSDAAKEAVAGLLAKMDNGPRQG